MPQSFIRESVVGSLARDRSLPYRSRPEVTRVASLASAPTPANSIPTLNRTIGAPRWGALENGEEQQ
jgi:hypothetical protein